MRKAKRLRLAAPASVSSFFSSAQSQLQEKVDVLLIGGGIMSATMGTYLQELAPNWSIMMVERLDAVAKESSNGWNNAGTGHAALMELNYTPKMPDGSINIDKAVSVNEAFQISRQFWAHQVEKKVLGRPDSFIHTVDHLSFVWGDENVEYLKARHELLQQNTLFQNMEFTEDKALLQKWAPLLMEGRDPNQKVAATRSEMGTDVDFGEINRQLVNSLQRHDNFSLRLQSEVRKLQQNADKSWTVTIADLANGKREYRINAKFVFIGAGGAALPLLQASGIPEASQYGGFPVGGQFLICDNPEVVKHHKAKAYGRAEVGAPPMSVPHLDTRYIEGKDVLLFGPFATFSTKFLKNGSFLDLIRSTNHNNLLPMTRVGLDNFGLVKYLMSQVMQNDNDRFNALKKYYPNARKSDWKLWTAGQRVQVIKKVKKGGQLQFGTEVVAAQDGTIAALLGASPGASTAAPIILNVLERVFPDKVSGEWRDKLRHIIPFYGKQLNGDLAATERELLYTSEVLQLQKPETHQAKNLEQQDLQHLAS
ncbi:malate dehydrogenase (quinone) [Shewanella mangrovi]|uniref:malate dehydrogenase (quinone) n=1 Tax=Shewanella mangrovi TaxID=1515746 RepID=UPI00068A165F|nr:malate dehydrogenase (quinone) [Shewanella mangrovi]